MPSQIRPNRLEVSDRFPMLGFTIRTESKRYEVAIASEVSLFRSDAKSKRTKTNFYSSRVAGLQPVDRGEAVYVLPAEVLARFVGNEKLYYALATYANGKTSNPELAVIPSEGSPYINLRGLSSRSMRRIQVMPSRQRAASSYGNGKGSELDWAGDMAMPGTQPASAGSASTMAPGNGHSPAPAAAPAAAPESGKAMALLYNDGFGPFPPPPVPNPRPAPPRSSGQAVGLGDEIPLDPGVGGLSIGPDSLEIGDIILSTTDAVVSRVIRAGTGSPISHALLFVGQGGQVIEAIGSGVQMIPLEQAIASATVAVAFRRPGLTEIQRQQIADAAAAHLDKDYDYVGIVRQAAFQLHSRACDMLPAAAQQSCRQWVGRIDLGTGQNDTFFCSALVIAAYEAAALPLTTTPPHWASPQDVAELAFRQGVLAYVGHLKAPPLVTSRSIFDVFGMGMSADPTEAETLAAMAARLKVSDIVADLSKRGVDEAEIRDLLARVAGCAVMAPEAVEAAKSRPPAALMPATATGLAAMPVPVGQARPVQLPRARAAETWERLAIEGALAVFGGPLAPTITALRAVSGSQGVSVGIGPSAGVGFLMGMGAGAGVIFAPGGRIGIYGQLDVKAGILDSVSAGLQVTIVRGGIEAFNEVAFAVGGAFVEGVEVTVQALLSPEHGFRGVSLELGVGLAVEPFEIFVAVEASVSEQVAGAQAAALSAPSRRYVSPRAAYTKGLALAARVPVEQAKPVTLPKARPASMKEQFAIDAIAAGIGVLAGPVGPIFMALRAVAVSQGASVAIGPAARGSFGVGGGFGLGAGVGAGIIFAPGGHVGVYGQTEVLAGFTEGLSAGIQVTIVRGGIDAFNEVGFAVGGAFVDEVELTVQVLFDSRLRFRGVSFELGAGIGADSFEIFGAIENSLASEVTAQAATLSYGASLPKLPPPPPPLVKAGALAIGVMPIVSAIAGAVMEKVVNHDGKITWQLEQLRGMKHPNDAAPSPAAAFRDAQTIRLDDWPYVEAVDADRISGWFSVDWQFNGKSLGNLQITNIGTNGALLQGLQVDAKIMDDNILYGDPSHAALRVRFHYQFTRAVGSDAIAITDLHLYGNGTFDKTSRWEQS
jgi:hypothetical protein